MRAIYLIELVKYSGEEQADLFAIMDEMDCTPSHAQAIKMRQMSEAKTGGERLAKDALVSIMKEEKPNQKEQFKIPKEKISRFFAPGTPTQKIEAGSEWRFWAAVIWSDTRDMAQPWLGSLA